MSRRVHSYTPSFCPLPRRLLTLSYPPARSALFRSATLLSSPSSAALPFYTSAPTLFPISTTTGLPLPLLHGKRSNVCVLLPLSLGPSPADFLSCDHRPPTRPRASWKT